METLKPRVGVGIIIINSKKQILIGKRINNHGANTWAFPGGKLEFAEEILDCAKRETLEETNLEIENLTIETITNDIHPKEDNNHYITIFVKANPKDEMKLKNLEPTKCENWIWINWNEIQNYNLYLPMKNLLKLNYNPF